MKHDKIINENSNQYDKEIKYYNQITENQQQKLNQDPKAKIYNDDYLEENYPNEDSYETKFVTMDIKKGEELKESLLGNNKNIIVLNSQGGNIKNDFLTTNLDASDNVPNALNFDLEKPSKSISNHTNNKNNNLNKNNNNDNFDFNVGNKSHNIYYANENIQVNDNHNKKKPSLSEPDFSLNADLDFSKENLLSFKNLEIFHNKLKYYFHKLQGFVYILLGCFFGTIVNFSYQYATQNGVSAITLLVYRGINLTLFSTLYLYIYFPELKSQFDKTQINSLISRALMNSIGMILVLSSLNHLRLNTLELLLRTGNLMSVYLGYYLINEVVTRWDLLSLLGTFFGIIFILKPHFIFGDSKETQLHKEDSPLGILLATSCAFIIAIANILTKKLLSFFNEIYLILVMGFSSILFGILFTKLSSLNFGISIFFIFYVFLVSIVEFFSVYFTFKSFKYESVTKLSPFFNSRIVFSVAITYFFYGQIDMFDLLGSSIILGIYIYSSYKKIQ